MRPITFLICLLMFSCGTQTSNHSGPAKIISDTASLYYKGKPLFVFGENIDMMSARPDFWLGDSTHKDKSGYTYVALDTFFITQQSTGSINGTVAIRTNNLRQIQSVLGWWPISVERNTGTLEEAINTIRAKYFPHLSQDFIHTKQDTIQHPSYIEVFKFTDTAGWNFAYEAKSALLKFQ